MESVKRRLWRCVVTAFVLVLAAGCDFGSSSPAPNNVTVENSPASSANGSTKAFAAIIQQVSPIGNSACELTLFDGTQTCQVYADLGDGFTSMDGGFEEGDLTASFQVYVEVQPCTTIPGDQNFCQAAAGGTTPTYRVRRIEDFTGFTSPSPTATPTPVNPAGTPWLVGSWSVTTGGTTTTLTFNGGANTDEAGAAFGTAVQTSTTAGTTTTCNLTCAPSSPIGLDGGLFNPNETVSVVITNVTTFTGAAATEALSSTCFGGLVGAATTATPITVDIKLIPAFGAVADVLYVTLPNQTVVELGRTK